MKRQQVSPFSEENEIITHFADVIVPVPVPNLYTYRVPEKMEGSLKVGARVIVQFGQKKVLTAVVAKIHNHPPQAYQAKYILELLDEIPLITQKQIELFQWMAQYYMCHVGEVLNVALPSGLKISSESKIQLNPQGDWEGAALTEREMLVLGLLQEKESLSYQEISQELDIKNVYQLIKSLVTKELILVFEEVKEKYQPKVVKKIRLQRPYLDKPILEKLLKDLEKKPKQSDIVLSYLRHVPVFRDWTLNEMGIEKSFFTKNKNLSNSSLKTLMAGQILEEFEVIVSRFEEFEPEKHAQVQLSKLQQLAFNQIMDNFERNNIVLLHGVTGSGKTEIYIELIQKVLQSGSQVLFLLPEIALTTQIVARLKKFFGSSMGIYHSKFSDNERVEVWQGVVSGKYNFVVGVRSSIFLPFDNLGLLIVDEEHENSYKQHDPAPRYHARDMAAVIAKQQHCKVLLGSATPSIESFYHAQSGRYGLVRLTERYGNAQLPQIELADIRAERKAKTLKSHFTSKLLNAMHAALQKGEQVILFQNRRGYAPYISCRDCAWVSKCQNCDVSLTYHLHTHQLVCHYCGYQQETPKKCPACGSTRLETVGHGTEKLEDELKLLFPEASIQRMDLDTTRQKNAYQKIIQDFEEHKIDILIGTQMISKGLDFDNVSLVGIFDIDRMIHFPDFRSIERAFQIMTQVSGRAGRKDKVGKVIIQTNKTDQAVLGKVIQNDYLGIYEQEIEEREQFMYPPFNRIIRLIIKHPQQYITNQAADELAKNLREKLGWERILGPEAPVISRVRNLYLKNILVKIERQNINLSAVKNFIQEQIEEITTQKDYRKIRIVVDVDAV